MFVKQKILTLRTSGASVNMERILMVEVTVV